MLGGKFNNVFAIRTIDHVCISAGKLRLKFSKIPFNYKSATISTKESHTINTRLILHLPYFVRSDDGKNIKKEMKCKLYPSRKILAR